MFFKSEKNYMNHNIFFKNIPLKTVVNCQFPRSARDLFRNKEVVFADYVEDMSRTRLIHVERFLVRNIDKHECQCQTFYAFYTLPIRFKTRVTFY